MDRELQEVFDLVVSRGINLFDTADSYGMFVTETVLAFDLLLLSEVPSMFRVGCNSAVIAASDPSRCVST